MVIVLGVISFVIIGIIGLWTVALRTGSESLETTTAANLATLLVNQRRLMPTAPSGTDPFATFALPTLDSTKDNKASATPLYTGTDGFVTNLANASYGLVYSITKKTRSSNVYLLLYWPPQAASTNAAGRYEIATEVSVP